MEPKVFKAINETDSDTGFRYRYIKQRNEAFSFHYHDYYEIFMVLKGRGNYNANGNINTIENGTLMFIRDFDIHGYRSDTDAYVEHINLAFTKETLNTLFKYLGKGFPSDILLSAKNSPSVILSEHEKNKLLNSLSELMTPGDAEVMKTKMRIKLVEIFTKYFNNYSEEESDIPLWLEITYEKMQKPENFIEGLSKMYKISGKTPEHLSRCMKKYYGITPSQLVTDMRINHCRNLLLSSNLPVTEICYECGFENMSWFYNVFQKKFGITPKQYREKYSK